MISSFICSALSSGEKKKMKCCKTSVINLISFDGDIIFNLTIHPSAVKEEATHSDASCLIYQNNPGDKTNPCVSREYHGSQ